VPYGAKSPAFIRERSLSIVRFLVESSRCAVAVVACNTATTHAVDLLRREFPRVPIVGMEPAIKPAARATLSGVVGILATEATLSGERVTRLIDRTAEGVKVLTQPCPGLVEQVEAGDLAGHGTIELLERYTGPLIARGADVLVLGCTHYTFLQPAIQRVVGPTVKLFDSAAAVARQTARVLGPAGDDRARQPSAGPPVAFLTSGEPDVVRQVLGQIWAEPVEEIHRLPV
jgi:glutamate racemase